MIKLGDKSVSALRLGGQEIKRAYLGAKLIFDAVPAATVYTITAAISPAGSGSVAGAGQYREGETVTLVAAPDDGYNFSGWQEGGQTVGTDTTYSFTATADRALVAAFEEKVSRLPAGYTEVEYVEMKSTSIPISFVNTGVTAKGKYLLDIELSESVSGTTENYLYRDAFKYSNKSYYFVHALTSSQLGYRYGLASGYTYFSVGQTKGRHAIEIDEKNGTMKFDSISHTTGTYMSGNQVKLGAVRNVPIKWHTVEIYLDEELTRHLIPCKNPSGTAGFYDIVYNNFYTLSGTTGTITAGPEV